MKLSPSRRLYGLGAIMLVTLTICSRKFSSLGAPSFIVPLAVAGVAYLLAIRELLSTQILPKRVVVMGLVLAAVWHVVFLRMGATGARQLELLRGATLEDLAKHKIWASSVFRVNGKRVRLTTVLREGDVVTEMPEAIVGGGGRHAHLDLDSYRKALSARDYDFFINFVGADGFGLRAEDLGDGTVP